MRSCTFTRSDISHGVAERRSLEWDRLAEGAVVEVRLFEGLSVEQAREPHRHDYHELIWVRSGEGEHLIDGDPVPVRPGAVTVIGRGRVHVFRRARDLNGALLRFLDVALDRGAGRAPARWMLAGGCARTIPVPADEDERLAALVARPGRRGGAAAGRLHRRCAAPPRDHDAAVAGALVRRRASGPAGRRRRRGPARSAASSTCSSATSPITTTRPTTPTRSACRPPRWPMRCARSRAARRRSS